MITLNYYSEAGRDFDGGTAPLGAGRGNPRKIATLTLAMTYRKEKSTGENYLEIEKKLRLVVAQFLIEERQQLRAFFFSY